MTALKQTKSSTALVRILALPMMVGVLAGCDYASKLPDAPSNLGGYDLSQKPPSVTGQQEEKRLPPPRDDAFAKLKAPVEDRTKAPAEAPTKLAMADKPAVKTPAAPKVAGTAPIDTPPLPTPTGQDVPLDQVAFRPLEFEANESAPAQTGSTDFAAPPVEMAAQAYKPQSATPPVYSQDTYGVNQAPAYQPYDAAPLDTYAVEGTSAQPEIVTYNAAPVEGYAIAAPPAMQAEAYIPPAGNAASSIVVLRSRLPNGAVVNVHPVIGAPGVASATLARTVVMNIGSPINAAAADGAAVVFDLRGRAERNTNGYVSVEWQLLDANKKVVGIFPERQDGSSWGEMGDSALRAMGQRVADRIARNGELRQATLYAAANPVGNSYATMAPIGKSTTFILKQGATLANAPTPRVSPRAATTYTAPVQVAARPAPVRVRQTAPKPMAAPAPVRTAPRSPQVVTQAPRPVAPPPTFDTLRPTNNTQAVAAPTVVATGPRPLVFRGVQGAPGDGDVALSREVGKLLAQSGARMSATPQPGALFLTAEVSKTPGANSDRIAIVWRVQDSSGANIGQVTQENDVPRGMLDNAWGEDAVYAAEGARDGIMELLQGVGALES